MPALRAAFDDAPPYTVGIEDEVMLLDPESLELAPRAQELLSVLDGDQRFKLELPSTQLEILTPASSSVDALGVKLLEARRLLADKAQAIARPACAGVHPFSAGIGELNRLGRYERTIEEYGIVASRQLVCALQVHVSIGDADRALAVYNAARSFLPLLAALAANAPFYEGVDTGLASVRPKLAELLPRQGVPPLIESWEEYAAALRWGAKAVSLEPRTWWWELRPHPSFGTLEFRVPDAQTTVADGMAIAAVTQALVIWLAERHRRGEALQADPSWRIEENRWSACRYGLDGAMVDLQSGVPAPTREVLHQLLETLDAHPGARASFRHAHALLAENGAIAQRTVAASGGVRAVAESLAGRFLAAPAG